MLGRFVFTVALLAAPIAGAGEAVTTRVSIEGKRWQINGTVTHPGTRAEGLLMNVRMVNAIFEDRGRADFDAEANTDRFIARIRDYAAQGVNAFTICLQGGMPGYEGALNSAFDPDGSLRPGYLARAERVIRACDRRGVVVILGMYYQRQSAILRDEAAVRAGVANASRWVRERGFQNVLLEIANEYPHQGYGLMLNKPNQTFPFHFDGPADDPVFYARLRLLTTPEPAAAKEATEDGRDYFPPPESAGGWRTLDKPEDIRRLGGADPAKLSALREWLLRSDGRDFAAVVIRHGYIVLEVGVIRRGLFWMADEAGVVDRAGTVFRPLPHPHLLG
jgi:hypothetical protein